MNQSANSFSGTVAFIWAVADLLRVDFRRSWYTRIILPFLLLTVSTDGLFAAPAEGQAPRINDYEGQTVPSDRWWRLCWSSPYESFEVHPAYDIRVSSGVAYIGDNFDRRTYVSAFTRYGSPQGPLDIAASSTEENICIWLPAGTIFKAANSLVAERIQVSERRTK
jgi:hypothetical protein